jgi:hypothetical protein
VCINKIQIYALLIYDFRRRYLNSISAQPAQPNIVHTHNQQNQHSSEEKPPIPQPNSKQKTIQTQKTTKPTTQNKCHTKTHNHTKRKTIQQSLFAMLKFCR